MIESDKLREKLTQLNTELNPFNRKIATLKIKLCFAEFFSDVSHYRYARIENNNFEWIDGEHEFLYDFIAVEEMQVPNNPDYPSYVTRTLLALETEMSDNFEDVIADFHKLLVCNAVDKVLVFKCHSDKLAEHLNYLETNIKLYKGGNGYFHLITWINNRFVFELKTIQVM